MGGCTCGRKRGGGLAPEHVLAGLVRPFMVLGGCSSVGQLGWARRARLGKASQGGAHMLPWSVMSPELQSLE